MNFDAPRNTEQFNSFGATHLPGHLGIRVLDMANQKVTVAFSVERKVMAPNGYLHAGSVVSLADTAAGYGCISHLPEGAIGFTTIELKTNFLGTAREGEVQCTAHAVHMGRTTQVWDAEVTHVDTGKTMALFRCTQMILYPKKT